MGMKINTELPLPAYLKAKYPLPEELVKLKAERDEEIRSIFEGKSDKFVVIVGPCSADREDSVCEYVAELQCHGGPVLLAAVQKSMRKSVIV